MEGIPFETRESISLASISDKEVEWACSVMQLPPDAFSGSNGADPRLSVMRSLDTLDVEACPGSGKTTLIVAKLAILAHRWNSRQQGVCVLSHTNAARSEIGIRLRLARTGNVLLRRPHFVGTIHSFVNEFIAMPWLRSKGWPIKAIDTNIAQKDRWRRLPLGTRRYLERNHDDWTSLEYSYPDFKGVWKERYPAHTDTYHRMTDACRESTASGYYCFDEMFVWATELLDLFPNVIDLIRHRFPIVFIDEVQDNSELQSSFLHRLLTEGDHPIVRQRFGDSNQAIYHRPGLAGAVTDRFPGSSKIDLPNSFRFGQEIANVGAPLGVHPQRLTGLGPTTSRINHAETCRNTLLLFDEHSVLNVLPAFARCLIASFPAEVLKKGDFRAVSGVHKSKETNKIPCFMGHYFPGYNPDIGGQQPKPNMLVEYLSRARFELASTTGVWPVTNYCAEGILHFIEKCGVDLPASHRKSPHRVLIELFPDEASRAQYEFLIDYLITSRCQPCQTHWRTKIAPAVVAIGESIAGRAIDNRTATEFLDMNNIRPAAATPSESSLENIFRYPRMEPKVVIKLGSIHSVKGETHTATLVLESYHRTHHLKKLIPWLVGKRPRPGSDNSGEDEALQERLRLHYVAMTRPSHLLALAMRRDSFSKPDLDLMQEKGWCVIDCCAPRRPKDSS